MNQITMRKETKEKTDVNVEDIWEDIGGFSTYQKWLTFALLLPQLPQGMIVLSPIFTGTSQVPMFCEDVEQHEASVNDSCISNCTYGGADRIHNSIVQEWMLICDKSWIVETITSVQMAGMMTGAFLSSIISDQFGRKKCYVYQTVVLGVFGMLPSLATGPWTYMIARYLSGVGAGACFVVYISHLMEFLIPTWRTLVGCVNFFTIGEMVLAPVAYYIRDWRWLTFATGLPAICLLVFYPLILESPRWLLVRSKTKEAYQVFAAVAKKNNKPPPSMQKVELLQHTMLKEAASQVHGIQAAKMIIANRTLFLHVAIETLCNATCAIVYYGVSFNTKNLSGNPYWNMFYLGLSDAIAMPALVIFNDWLGRRKTFTIYMMSGTGFIIVLVALLLAGVEAPITSMVLALGAKCAILTCWGALTVIMFETAPTNLRSTCGGFIFFMGYVAAILAPQLFLLSKVHVAIPYVTFCILTVGSSISSWFLCETLNRPLEDTA